MFTFSVPHARGDEPAAGGFVRKGEKVFPTHVGMNRTPAIRDNCMPFVFPTHVGMNQPFSGYCPTFPGVPHARGDEPR